MNDEPQSDKLSMLQVEYLEAMRLGSGRAADRVVQRALDTGIPVGDIYLDIFQPTAYAIGRLWQSNRFSVAQEHLATAIIERQMGELHPLFRPKRRRLRRLVIGCVPNEQHRVGARMVADFFEADGWEVHYLGAAVPIPSFAAMAQELHADMIGLSVEMVYHLPHISDFARTLDQYGLDGIPIMVGGMPFVQQPELARTLNVRFSAANAREAVRLANQVFTVPDLAPLLRPPVAASSQTLAAFRRARAAIISRAVTRSLERGDEVAQLGDCAEEVLAAGFGFLTRMLETALLLQNTELLDRQIAWSNERQPHDGVPPAHLLSRFKIYADAVDAVLPPIHAAAVNQYVRWMIARQQDLLEGMHPGDEN